MRRSVLLPALLATLTGATALAAQGPGGPAVAGGPGAPGGPIGNTAGFVLAHTGDLQLTDAQVVKIAAIARRGDARRRATMAGLDSLRPRGRGMANDSAARAAQRRAFEQMQPSLERAREAERTDMRDVIAVLTADQQARAWELVARRPMGFGGRGMGFSRGQMGGGRGMGPGRGPDGPSPRRGTAPDRRPPNGPPGSDSAR